MSWSKVSLVLSTGILLVGLSSLVARSQDGPAPSERGDSWDRGPGLRELAAGQQPPPPRGDEDGPPGPRGMRGDDQPPPPPGGDRRPPRPPRGDGDRSGPPQGPGGPDDNGPPPRGGPDGDRMPPPGAPDGPGGRDDLESLKTRDPELYKAMQQDRDLERQTRDLAEQYRRADK